MAFGVERSPALCAALTAALGVFCWTGAALAQLAVAPPVAAVQEVISQACETPFSDTTPAPLPRLASALESKAQIRVMAVGSSSTVGVGATSPARSYPNQLSAILLKSFKDLNLTVVNRGVSGETAAATAERMKMLVAMEKPTLVLWQVGTNDALSRVGVEEFDDTVRDTLRWLKSHKIDIVLVGLQYTAKAQQDEHYQAIRERLTKVATEEGVLLVRRFAAMQFLEKVKGQATLVGDDLHHNDFGYRCMAEHIARAMVVSSFLSRKRDAKEHLTR